MCIVEIHQFVVDMMRNPVLASVVETEKRCVATVNVAQLGNAAHLMRRAVTMDMLVWTVAARIIALFFGYIAIQFDEYEKTESLFSGWRV